MENYGEFESKDVQTLPEGPRQGRWRELCTLGRWGFSSWIRRPGGRTTPPTTACAAAPLVPDDRTRAGLTLKTVRRLPAPKMAPRRGASLFRWASSGVRQSLCGHVQTVKEVTVRGVASHFDSTHPHIRRRNRPRLVLATLAPNSADRGGGRRRRRDVVNSPGLPLASSVLTDWFDRVPLPSSCCDSGLRRSLMKGAESQLTSHVPKRPSSPSSETNTKPGF